MVNVNSVARDQLRSIVSRIERLHEEKKAIEDDLRDMFAEAKANGYDVKALKVVISKRRQDVAERQEHEAIVETYMHALGMIPGDEIHAGAHSASGSGQASGEPVDAIASTDTSLPVGGAPAGGAADTVSSDAPLRAPAREERSSPGDAARAGEAVSTGSAEPAPADVPDIDCDDIFGGGLVKKLVAAE